MSFRAIIFKVSGYVVRCTILFFLCVLLVGLLFTYVTRDNSVIHVSLEKLIDLDNVHSLQVSDGMGTTRSPLFQVNNKKGEAVVEKVVNWINSAKVVNGSIMPPITHGFPPPVLLIYDNLGEKGQYIRIQPALIQ